jgi:ubiquinone/menaquinone biosynthesis C-methylase UbiE
LVTSEFNVHNAAGYEQLMGRWSQKLAPLFIDFAGVADGERIVDVGCGTGSLTFALARARRRRRDCRESIIRQSLSRKRSGATRTRE